MLEQEAKLAGVNLLMNKPMFRSSLISAFNQALGIKEAEKEEPEEEGEEVPADEEEEFEVQYARLRKVVDGLPEKCREIFILGCVDGLSYKEVSEKMGVSVNTVKTQIKLAYRKLKLELGGQNFVWEWTAGGVLFILMQK